MICRQCCHGELHRHDNTIKRSRSSHLAIRLLRRDMRDVPLDILYGVAHTDRQGATLGEEAVTEGTRKEVMHRSRSCTM